MKDMKTLKQLEEENADIINDKVLQEICEWGYRGSPIENLKDDEPFDEVKYLERAKENLTAFKEKCEKVLKNLEQHPKSELRKDSTIKFKEKLKDIPPDNFDFKDKMAVDLAYESLKNKHKEKGS